MNSWKELMMIAQPKLVSALIVAAACAFAPAGAHADPIVPNAQFSLGNTGFSGGYTYLAPTLPNPTMMWPERTYTVATDPASYHSRWPSFGDHTTGDGGMMIVNGSPDPGITVWSVAVDVDPNTLYDVTAWAASVTASVYTIRSPGPSMPISWVMVSSGSPCFRLSG
jgi:hypothetical protein